MKYILLSAILILNLITYGQKLIVKTTGGRIQGYQNKDKSINIFKGIPFAAAPIAEKRWQAPQEPENWTGIKNCTKFSASPIQNKPQAFYCWSEEFIAKPEPLSEDCLYLNVWTGNKSKKTKQPVFVWIYGGGLNSGSANCDIYDGEMMSKKGIVFVSLNYRVGVFGFMAHPELSKASGVNASGNYGFLDQIAALKWVQKNITAFGGDPNNVTIAGQSAGAFSVTALIASPLAKGLFHKAIPQSGGLLSKTIAVSLKQSEDQGLNFMRLAKVNSIEALKNLPAEQLQTLSNNSAAGRFGVTLDGYVIPENLKEHFKNKRHNQTPVLTGWVTGDGSFLGNSSISVDKYEKEAKNIYGENSKTFLTLFPGSNADEIKLSKQKLALFGFAGLPAHALALFNTQPTYIYQFSHVPPDKPNFPNYGAFHTSEVPYALNTLHTWQRPWTNEDLELQNNMNNYWVNFAKTGNPNGKGLPVWETYNKESGKILILDSKIELKPKLFKKEFDFLEQY